MRRAALPSLPGRAARRAILHYGRRIRDPLERLQFFYLCAGKGERYSRWARRWPFCWRLYRLALLEFLSRSHYTADSELDWRDRAFVWTFRSRRKLWTPWKTTLAGILVLAGLSGGWVLRQPDSLPSKPPSKYGPPSARALAPPSSAKAPSPQEVWLVESDQETDLYSNGLRVSNRYRTYTGPRSYPVFPRGGNLEKPVRWRHRPLGVVFHTSESDLVAFRKDNNQRLRYLGEALLEYTRRNTLYNFVIDRFGQVYRVVPESQYAEHAGHSLWADADELYLNLNHSFIGVAFETPAVARRGGSQRGQEVTPAQRAGGRLLTEMLRAKFGIVGGNAVTHEMVSLNPANGLIGYHTDWQGRFPFGSLGLPDNYQRPMPSVAEWGFRYDAQFLQDVGGRPWPGVPRSQQSFRREAARRGLSLERHRRQQQQRFRELRQQWKRLRDEAARRGAQGSASASRAGGQTPRAAPASSKNENN